MKTLSLLLVLCGLSWTLSDAALAQGRSRGALPVHEAPKEAGIAWFGSWDAAFAEAKRTKRPILFMSAAPQCQSVPGVW
jgi:hypothetical protein